MGMAHVIPSTQISTYSITRLKACIYEIGRTYGWLQCDQEPAITALAKAVIREIGGMKLRLSPKYSSGSLVSDERWHQTMRQARVFEFMIEQNYRIKIP